MTVILGNKAKWKNANQFIELIGIFLLHDQMLRAVRDIGQPTVNVMTNDNKTACFKSGVP